VGSSAIDVDVPARASRGKESASEMWLVGGGEMGKVIRSMDWSATALGPIASWPQSLRTTVSLCLASNFPISLAWGPKHVQIYNDGYWPICGGKHPYSMGQDFSECWASAWPAIGEAFERALGGATSFLEDQRMFLDRNGYLEETFFTFSFSPIRDESGGVGGLFHPVTETTTKMLSERRTRTLRDLAARTGKAKSTEEALSLAAQTLADAELDLPFALFYSIDAEAGTARLAARAGHLDAALRPELVDFRTADSNGWSLPTVAESGEAMRLDDLHARFGAFSCGPYPESPKTALALPITMPGSRRPIAILIAGVSSRLPLTDTYSAFYDLLATGVARAVSIARAYEEERRRAEALAEIDRAKTAFFSNVSHEFRTPLTLMLGPLEDELAEHDHPLTGARRERLETAHRNTLRLLRLVNTLLDFSRIEAGRIQASYEPTDLSTCTAELASAFRSAVEKAGLTLTVDCPPLPEPVYVDRDMWEKIVLNLLSNAFKHTFKGGITVALRWLGDGVELTVADSGVGILEAELPRLFERFHRVKGARSRTHEGTGIGLALVQELVRLHGGIVRVESRPDEGTTFSVSLRAGHAHFPSDRVEAHRTLDSTPTRATTYVEEAMHWLGSAPETPVVAGIAAFSASIPPSAAAPKQGAPRRRVLWVDDNADMRDYVQRLLSGSYEVTAVADGAAALAAARRDPPDLVLSDVMMPELDGFGLLRELRGDARTRTIPVILLSARAGEEAAVEGLGAGADDYLIKPFSARELLARVRTHIELAAMRREWARELERANKELESFSYSVSHDLRSPLRAMDGYSRILLADHGDKMDDAAKSYLNRIRAATGRMSALIDGLLNLARVSRGAIKRESVNLSGIARVIADELQRGDGDRHAVFDVEDNVKADADSRLVAVVLENLLGNAWKYTGKREGAHIEFGQLPGAPSTYFVRDNGAGFEMAYAAQLFQPFTRLHTDDEFEGTGIGLATVHRVISRHRGRVWAEAAPEKGATFFFTLTEHP
jgi:signal transduction histidine kinase